LQPVTAIWVADGADLAVLYDVSILNYVGCPVYGDAPCQAGLATTSRGQRVFGQNFAWPIAHLRVGLGNLLLFGLGSELVAIVILLVLFQRRGWFGSGPTA